MNLTNIISNEEPVGGLELSDNTIKFSLLKKNGSSLEVITLVTAEESKQDKTGYFIKDEASLTSKIKEFANKYGINYVILSIPSDLTFAKTYSFPGIMPDEKVTDSIKLIAELQLPQKPADIYWDSLNYDSKREGKSEKSVLLSFAKKSLIDNLIANTKKAGLKVIAVESRAISLARAIEQKPEEVLLVVERDKTATSFYVIKNNQLLFLQSLDNKKIGANLNREIKQIIKYFEWLSQPITGLFLNGRFEAKEIKSLPIKLIKPELNKKIKAIKAINPSSFVVLGAALRGSLPRQSDNNISLMDVGTEEAYEQAKAQAGVNFLMSITIALAAFFIIAFYSTWTLIAMTQRNFNEEIISFNNTAESDPYTLSSRAQSFNKIIQQASALAKTSPHWSLVVSEIKSRISPNITIKNLALTGPEDVLSLTGTAKSREDINSLRRTLEESRLLKNVNIPLDNLGKKEDIPFAATFQIKNSKLIYSQNQ